MPEKLQVSVLTDNENIVTKKLVVAGDEVISYSAPKKGIKMSEKPQDITYTRDRGIMKKIIRPGEDDETPPYGVKVKINYTGKLKDGTIFDTTWSEQTEPNGDNGDSDEDDENESETRRDRIGKPIEFELGVGSVIPIKAWDICVASMKKREIASFECRHDYAYHDFGSPPEIPPYAALFFEIEMLDWDSDLTAEKDGGVLKTTMLKVGEPYARPNDGATVEIHVVGKYEGKVFENRNVTFPLGEGAEYDVCEGIEIGLPSFNVKEKSRLKIKSKYAFGAAGNAKYNIPKNADVEYSVTLKSFEPLKSPYTLHTYENIKQAGDFKDKGTAYFNARKFPLAVKMYKRIEDYVGKEFRKGEELYEKCGRKDLMVAMHLNLALCYLKMNKDKDAKDQCDKALEWEPNNEKAVFRRGQSYMNLREFELAMQDFKRVVRLNPRNGSALRSIRQCKEMIDELRTREKKLYGSMF